MRVTAVAFLLLLIAAADAIRLRGVSGVPTHWCIQTGKECPDTKEEHRYEGAPTDHPNRADPRREADVISQAAARDKRNAPKNEMLEKRKAEIAAAKAENKVDAEPLAQAQGDALKAAASAGANAGKIAGKAAAHVNAVLASAAKMLG